MKERTITGVILFIFLAPFILFGGHVMMVLTLLLLIAGTYEFLNVIAKSKQDKIPLYVYIVSFIFAYLIIFDLPIYDTETPKSVVALTLKDGVFDYKLGVLNNFMINPIWIISYVFVLFTCSVFDKRFKITNAMYTFTTILYLSLGLKGMLYLRSLGISEQTITSNTGLWMFCFILLVTCITDIFAYFGGMTCYKLLKENKVHKLNERISPKKTVEGTIIGTIFGTTAGFFFMTYFMNGGDYSSWALLLLMSLALSLCGQIGDLILSAIKRHYSIKDYSSLLPGHGGILDRFDSLLINCMVAALFISLMAGTELISFI